MRKSFLAMSIPPSVPVWGGNFAIIPKSTKFDKVQKGIVKGLAPYLSETGDCSVNSGAKPQKGSPEGTSGAGLYEVKYPVLYFILK